jgi:hypothetical protein
MLGNHKLPEFYEEQEHNPIPEDLKEEITEAFTEYRNN